MKYGDDIIYDTTPETILGYQIGEDKPRCLELISGDRYEIQYGIHQGTFRYEGKIADNAENRKNHPFSIGCHMFRNEKTGELSFGYYGYTSPSEFVRIVRHINKR